MFYLKYRPQKIEELDLKKVRERLKGVLGKESVSSADRRVPHAFLFSGPRGAGKTSAARIVAKAINCANSKVKSQNSKIEPCNNCNSCVAIMQGRHLDIIEIDGASNRGIDQIRDLRDKIGLSPSSAKYKVYIIDEVHMLTKEAFNALLKTLEEPPKHAIFILATTEPHRLPDTIKSRCVEILFSKASEEEILRSLRRVIKGEGLKVEKEAIGRITASVDGSFRDAVKILEEAAGDGEKIGVKEVEKIIGGGFGVVEEFLELLGEKKVKKLLGFINEKVKEGVDPSWLTKAALDRLHREFLAGYNIGEIDNRGNQGDKGFKMEDLIKLMRLFEGAAREEKEAVVEQMPLELAIIEWTGGDN